MWSSYIGATQYEISKLNIKLPQNSVQAFWQDEQGHLWLGTQNGVSRYNGIESTSFYAHQDNAQCGLPHPHILTIIQDSQHTLWVGTKDGVAFKKQQSDCFERALDTAQRKSNKANSVHVIHEDNQGNIWFIGNKVHFFNLHTQSFTLIEAHNLDKITLRPHDHLVTQNTAPTYSDILTTLNNEIWLTSNHGLLKFNQAKAQFDTIFLPSHSPNASLTNITQAPDGTLWVGSDLGVYHLTEYGDYIQHYIFNHDADSDLDNFINAIYVDHHQRLWVATSNGLYRYLDKYARFKQYLYSDLHINRIANLTSDTSDQLWVSSNQGVYRYNSQQDTFWQYTSADGLGTVNGGNAYYLHSTRSGAMVASVHLDGLYKIESYTNKFPTLQAPLNNALAYDNHIVRALYEDPYSDGNTVWMGLDGAGVKKLQLGLDQRGHTIVTKQTRFLYDSPVKTMPGEYIHDIVRDHHGTLWLASNAGLRQWDEQSERFTPYQLKFTSKNELDTRTHPLIYTFLNDKQRNKLWLAGDAGFGYIQAQATHWFDASQFPQLKNTLVYKLFQDTQGRIWLSTGQGLGLFNPRNQSMRWFKHDHTNSNTLSENWVHGVWQQGDNTFWVATRGGGLNQLKLINDEATWLHFTTEHGLADNTLYSILGDEKHNMLWVATNKGLSSINLKSLAINNYNTSDGLQADEFNYGVAHIGRSGYFYFGGINGFNRFLPQALRTNNIAPSLSLNKVTVHNKAISADTHHFHHSDNYFAFHFSGQHLVAPEQLEFEYTLAGLDQNWINAGQSRVARYNALPPGEYTFVLRAKNLDDVWSDKTALFHFTIASPFWQTPWAIISYIVAAMLIAWLYKHQRDKTQSQLEQKIKQATAELASNNQHIRMHFQSFAHEVKTPLLQIATHCHVALSELGTQSSKTVSYNIEQALAALDNVRSGVKLELDNAEQRFANNNAPCHIDIATNLKAILPSRLHRAQLKDIKCHVYIEPQLTTCLQVGSLELIVSNLLDNAIQYTPNRGSVILKAYEQENKVIIEVTDTGLGIEEERVFTIFQHGERTQNAGNKNGRGMGLFLVKSALEVNNSSIEVDTQVGHGTSFRLTLPKGETDKVITANAHISSTIQSEQAITPNSTLSEAQWRLLIVDDNAALRKSMLSLFNKHFYCFEANSAAQGIEVASKELPDIILTDIQMEHKTAGLELIETLKAEDKTSHIPIIACSAAASPQTQVDAMRANAVAWIDKSSAPDFILSQVLSVVENHKAISAKVHAHLKQQKSPIPVDNLEQYFIATLKTIICELYQEEALQLEQAMSQQLKESTRNIQLKAKKYLPSILTLKTCLQGYRGLQAAQLLLESNMPIKAIYTEVGFANERQMSRWFMKHTGDTPSAYRKAALAPSHYPDLTLIANFFSE